MWLHRLEIDARLPAARRDLSSAYELHSTLARGFVAGPTETPPRFLWRVESADERRAIVLIQGDSEADWSRIDDATPGYVLAQARKQIALDTLIVKGTHYRFRLRANPTVTRDGKRHGLVRHDEQMAWLERQITRHGFELSACVRTTDERLRVRQRRDGGRFIVLQAVGFEGSVVVVDSTAAIGAVRAGLGHAKAFGLGLLSLARL